MANTRVKAGALTRTHAKVTQSDSSSDRTVTTRRSKQRAEYYADLPITAAQIRAGLRLTERDGDLRSFRQSQAELDLLLAAPLFPRAASIHALNMKDATAEPTAAQRRRDARVFTGILCLRMFRAGYLAAQKGGAQ